jgi:hypothetical protein
MSETLYLYSIYDPLSKICGNTIYFLQTGANDSGATKVTNYLQFNGSTMQFDRRTFTETHDSTYAYYPCTDDPNGNQLMINKINWVQKVDMMTISGHYNDYYVYRILLTADHTN